MFSLQWVGGVVGERNFNFFIQFCSYAGLFALFVMIVMSIFVAEERARVWTPSVFFLVPLFYKC
jgi:palmitoyltransferase